MDVNDFPSNSNERKRAERPVRGKDDSEKKVERVVKSEIVRRKKPVGKRFFETFAGGDARSVWGYVVMDVLIPAAKDMVADATTQGVERMIFGESRSAGRRSSSLGSSSNGYVSYNRFSSSQSRGSREEPRSLSRRSRATHDFDEIILATRVEADEVIDRLFYFIDKYEVATVADLYDLVGASGDYTDNKWGWSDLRGSGQLVSRVREGYLLNLPKPEPLD